MELVLAFGIIGALSGISYVSAPAAAFLVASLAFGSVGFWIILATISGLLFYFIDDDNGVGATATLLGFIVVNQMFGDIKIFSYVRAYPWQVVKLILVYFAAGTAWSIAKWWFHVRNLREKFDEEKVRFFAARKSWGKTDEHEMTKEWEKNKPKKPSPSESKDKIIRWMSFWPWSMAWTLVNDPIKKMFRSIYRSIEGLLQRIADRAWAGAE